MMQASATRKSRLADGAWMWIGPLLFMSVVSLYFLIRFGGRWAEADSSVFANLIRIVIQEGRLLPINGDRYPNGYAYQVISAYIVALTGLDVGTLQQLVYPLVTPLVVLPAWVLYREWTGSARAATLTTLLLFTQPEFLFVILRSSHEKFTRTFMLLCFFWLARSFKLRDRPWLFAVHVGLFYVTAYAFIATNNLLAHSFILAIAFALILGRVLERRNPHLRQQHAQALQRLPYAVLICLGLVYIFTFYLYPPAAHDLVVLQSIWMRGAALAIGGQESSNAYATVASSWISLPVYFLLSIANWIILAASLMIWMWQGFHWLWRRTKPQRPMAWLVWLFYVAFAAQGALSVVADASGSLTGNLQHRLFPSFAIVAVAVVGSALAQWRPRRMAAPSWAGLSAGIACVAILSVLKATNEPLLSNKWTFYRADELLAVEWNDTHLRGVDIWAGFDERLSVAFNTIHSDSLNRNRFVGNQPRATTHDLIVTDVMRMRGRRLNRPLPLSPDAFRVYDNGDSQSYHERPQTPYQR